MAQDRLQRVRRILAVQEQLHKVEQYRLAEAQQHLAHLVQDQHALISSLNAEDGLQGLFMDATVRRLKSLADQEMTATRSQDDQELRTREVGAKVGVAQRLFDTAFQQARRAEEAGQLADTVERVAAQAPGKIV